MPEKTSRSPLSRRALGEHPWREILHRFSDPRFAIDSGVRAITQVWDRVSPAPFSVLYRKVSSHTMCSNARLRALHQSCKDLVKSDVPGAMIECGCARGGSAALIALTLQQLGARRELWLFDTFEGLPAPSKNDPDFDFADAFTGTCVGTIEDVTHLFAELRVKDNTHFVKGLFQNTLAPADIGPIALLHIDGDWYDSVRVCLEVLYDKVSPGGIIQFDDYGYWQGARKAVDEFMQSRGINAPLRRIDYSGRSLIKVNHDESGI